MFGRVRFFLRTAALSLRARLAARIADRPFVAVLGAGFAGFVLGAVAGSR